MQGQQTFDHQATSYRTSPLKSWSTTQKAHVKEMGTNTIPCALKGYLLRYCPRLLIRKHLAGGLEEYLPPTLDERISFCVNLNNFRLKFLFCSKEAVP
jgi:hypothetical protein